MVRVAMSIAAANALLGVKDEQSMSLLDKQKFDYFLSEEYLEGMFEFLYNYIEEKYTGDVFSLLIEDGAYSFVVNGELEKMDEDLLIHVINFMDVACIFDLVINWNVDEIYIDTEEEIPYYEEPAEVDDYEIQYNFTFPDPKECGLEIFENVDLTYSGPLVFPGMEEVTDADWEFFLDSYLKGGDNEEEVENGELLGIEELEDEETDVCLRALKSLEGMNLS